jgi:hypothetical protein
MKSKHLWSVVDRQTTDLLHVRLKGENHT